MRIKEIAKIVDADIINEHVLHDREITFAFSSDLMSDVLTINVENLMLITGLNNVQTIRTAEMAEISSILFVRNKKPTKEMIELANEQNIVLLLSGKSMFHASGILFGKGLKPVY